MLRLAPGRRDALLEAGATDQALHYARRGAGLAGAWHQTGALTDIAVRLLEERGEASEAVAMRRHHLGAAPNLSSFTALRRTATSAGSWPAERLDALDVLLAHNPDDWLRALLADGDPDVAWEAARTMELPRSLRLQLVRARARTHPDQVHDDYVAIIDDTLTEARRENYREAMKLLGELRRASEAGRRVEEYDARTSRPCSSGTAAGRPWSRSSPRCRRPGPPEVSASAPARRRSPCAARQVSPPMSNS